MRKPRAKKKRYGLWHLNHDTTAMLTRRNIFPHPMLVTLITDFCYQQLAARPREVLRRYRTTREETDFSREKAAAKLMVLYNKAHEMRSRTVWQGIKEMTSWRDFEPDQVNVIRDMEAVIEARIARKDRATRNSAPGGWSSRIQREQDMRKLKALRKVLLVIRP